MPAYSCPVALEAAAEHLTMRMGAVSTAYCLPAPGHGPGPGPGSRPRSNACLNHNTKLAPPPVVLTIHHSGSNWSSAGWRRRWEGFCWSLFPYCYSDLIACGPPGFFSICIPLQASRWHVFRGAGPSDIANSSMRMQIALYGHQVQHKATYLGARQTLASLMLEMQGP